MEVITNGEMPSMWWFIYTKSIWGVLLPTLQARILKRRNGDDEIMDETYTRYDFLNDIFFKNDKQINIAKKYDTSTSYVSQIAKKFKQLKYIPLVLDDKLVCWKCKDPNKKNLVFHHSHITGEQIALICDSCNLKKDLTKKDDNRGAKKIWNDPAHIGFNTEEYLKEAFWEDVKEDGYVDLTKYFNDIILQILGGNHPATIKFREEHPNYR